MLRVDTPARVGHEYDRMMSQAMQAYGKGHKPVAEIEHLWYCLRQRMQSGSALTIEWLFARFLTFRVCMNSGLGLHIYIARMMFYSS